jgi:hypothetical protein
MRRCVVALGAALALGGCATSGPTGSQVLSLGAKAGSARLVIYRTSSAGLLIQPDYFIDGKRAGSAQPNGFVVCELRPGRHTVTVGNLPSISIGEGADSVTLSLRAGTTTYLHAQPRMGIMTPGSIGLARVPEKQGRSDTAELYRVEGQCGRS